MTDQLEDKQYHQYHQARQICIKFLDEIFMVELVQEAVKKNDGVFCMEKLKEIIFEIPLENRFITTIENMMPFGFFSQDANLKFLEKKISNDPNFISEIEEDVEILNSFYQEFDKRFEEVINDFRVK